MQTACPLTIEIDMSSGKSRNGRLELNDLRELTGKLAAFRQASVSRADCTFHGVMLNRGWKRSRMLSEKW
jgi:hypothetical protein